MFFFALFFLPVENKCDKCDIHAFCDKGICKCRPPYIGDGITCNEPDEPAS